MADFRLEKPFLIDNGELSGLSPQECFVLGYELAMIDAQLQCPEPFERPIHGENWARVKHFCSAAGRSCHLSWMPDDSSESWAQLRVN